MAAIPPSQRAARYPQSCLRGGGCSSVLVSREPAVCGVTERRPDPPRRRIYELNGGFDTTMTDRRRTAPSTSVTSRYFASNATARQPRTTGTLTGRVGLTGPRPNGGDHGTAGRSRRTDGRYRNPLNPSAGLRQPPAPEAAPPRHRHKRGEPTPVFPRPTDRADLARSPH